MNSATRRQGIFFTPLPFAKKACEYLGNCLKDLMVALPERLPWYQSGDYRLWDMAAGKGNLELFLPKEFLPRCYLSTLEQEDVLHLEKEFSPATVFQYDYLDDDIQKMPNALRKDLANPKIKWIIWVNPPYATAQEAGLKGTSKEGVSHTKTRRRMHTDGLGEVSRELYVQFLYRIMHEFKDRETVLGLFSPLKYLISANYQKFRDNVFHAGFLSGFMFSSENFAGTSKTSHFPVGFILWDIGVGNGTKACMESSKMTEPDSRHSASSHFGFCSAVNCLPSFSLDILDSTTQKTGVKMVKTAQRNDFLSRWIKRPRGTNIFPPFSSALTIKSGNVDTRNRIADGFLASLMCPGNELQNQQQTALLSGPQVSAGALSVTPDNFEQAVIVFSARRIPRDSWVNHVDQLMRPNREPSPEFISDCAVWSLFDSKNQTVALRNVCYQERTYQVVNHVFPFSAADMSAEPPSENCTELTNSFVADWLARQTLSAEAQEVLASARNIYRFFFANWDVLRREKFNIESRDAGWYQIRLALLDSQLAAALLADLKYRHDVLKGKILPMLYDFGILNR